MFIGAQYFRPPFPDRAYWADDLARMRDLGFTGLQLWMFWSWVEHEPGTYDFGDHDELVTLADKNGLGVVLSVQCELQPPWIHRLVPGSEMIDHMGRKVISTNRTECNFGITPGGCFDHPGVAERMQKYFRTAAKHYANAANLRAWDCWNELRWNVHSDGYVCYCEHTLAAFRKWLEERHGGLDGLNRTWKRRYASWEDVFPGKLPRRPWTELVEFSRFISARSDRHAKDLYSWLREGDPDHMIVAHNGGPSWQMGGGEPNQPQCRGNDWSVADSLDGFGLSSFPYWGRAWTDAEHAVRIESMRAAAGKKPFWAAELQGGAAAGGFHAFRPVDGPTQSRWVWHGIGRGAKATIFWCWRDEVFGSESGGFGIIGNDGRREERLGSLRIVCAALKEHDELLDSYRPDPPQAAVLLEPTANFLQFAQQGSSPDVVGGANGYLLALARAKVPFTLLDAGHMDSAHADELFDTLKLVIAPVPLTIRPVAAERLEDFVMRGGTLVVEGELDAFDELGFYRYPGDEARAFAARVGVAEVGRREIPGGPVGVLLGKKLFKLTPMGWITPYVKPGSEPDEKPGASPRRGSVRPAGESCQATATDVGKRPLGLVRTLGRGCVFAFGGFFGRAYAEGGSPDFPAFVEALAKTAGVEPAFVVSGSRDAQDTQDTQDDGPAYPVDSIDPRSMPMEGPGEITWQSGVSGGTRLVFIMNNGPEQTARLTGGHESAADYEAATELVTGKALARLPGGAGFAVPLPAKGAAVVRLER